MLTPRCETSYPGAKPESNQSQCFQACFIASISTEGCYKPCPKNNEPICGTAGVTYDNICLMKIAGSEKPEVSILLIHDGHFLQGKHKKSVL
jgi:hypothetical protein